MPIPSTPRDVDRVSAQQQIYNTLKDWIVDGTLVPGEFINDSEIAKYFSVSRTPVREAILLLSQQDFVKIMPSKGTKVTETSEEAAAFIYEAISCLSAEIARLAVRKQKPGDIDELKRLNARFAFIMEAQDYSRILEADTNFHNYILKMADNPYMESCWRQILPHAHRYELLYFKSGINKEQSVADHDDIIRAIADKSEGEAARFSQQNWIGFFNERLRPQLIEAGAKKS
ncbi:MAG TPA: GntR family transcriptional regulator [Candidatus Enterocloster excrementipullorum]|uniref:GntR family transcriptional regulator n=1 Tax=Candidatus Enterocloster excrementipullorum TaxID=2838559 RepID=A0A9D2N321_9FIRM|nr:GntR family transcriptional regulator [Candidatus Enterocloster excrementipullorum]